MSAKKITKAKAPKATKPAAKPKAAGKTAQAPKTVKGECPAGGKHEWHTDDDGERECKKCHEPGDAPKAKKPAKAKPASKKAETKPKKLSALNAAAKVLADAGESMSTKQMIEAMTAKGYWTSPSGKTPQATLYTVVTMLPKPWQPGIDYSPKTGCDRSMDRGGGRRNLLMFKGLREVIAIRSDSHGRHKNNKNQSQEVAVASSAAGVCLRST